MGKNCSSTLSYHDLYIQQVICIKWNTRYQCGVFNATRSK